MLGREHRTAVSVSSRTSAELAAARKFLHSKDSDLALEAASERLWRHARRTMRRAQAPGCIIMCPEVGLTSQAAPPCIEEQVETPQVAEPVGV